MKSRINFCLWISSTKIKEKFLSPFLRLTNYHIIFVPTISMVKVSISFVKRISDPISEGCWATEALWRNVWWLAVTCPHVLPNSKDCIHPVKILGTCSMTLHGLWDFITHQSFWRLSRRISFVASSLSKIKSNHIHFFLLHLSAIVNFVPAIHNFCPIFNRLYQLYSLYLKSSSRIDE